MEAGAKITNRGGAEFAVSASTPTSKLDPTVTARASWAFDKVRLPWRRKKR